MALSLYKLAQPLMKNYSIRTIRKGFGWGIEDSVSQILNTFDEDVIKNALENAQIPKPFLIVRILLFFISGCASLYSDNAILLRILKLLNAFLSMVVLSSWLKL